MEWQEELKQVKQRDRLAEQMGGAEAVARQHAQGKLTVRERIAALADAGSFQEIGGLAGTAVYEGEKLTSFVPSPAVIGFCALAGRKVVISARDATVPEEKPHTDMGYKLGYAQKQALQWQLPFIRLLDATEGGVLEIDRAARTYLPDADTADEALRLLGVVPVVSAVMGPVAGLTAIEASLSHFSVMVKGTGQIFIADPSAVKTKLGYDIAPEALGGTEVQARESGVIDNVADSEEEAFSIIKRFLSYLPNSVWEMPPRIEPTDDPNRRDEELISIIPESKRKLYNPYQILKHVLDKESFFEIAPLYGRSTIAGLARVDGYPVGVMTKNPMSPPVGAMDVAAGNKVIRFVRLCDTFHLPMVYFIDEPGFMVGLEAQQQGIVRAGAQVVLTAIQTKMPWISFITRQLYGVAGNFFYRPSSMNKHYGWITANWGGMHVEGGTMAAYRSDIESAPDPEAKRKEIEHYLQVLSSTFRTAEVFEVEDLIDPRDTRPLLCDFIKEAQKVVKTQLGPGNGPIFLP